MSTALISRSRFLVSLAFCALLWGADSLHAQGGSVEIRAAEEEQPCEPECPPPAAGALVTPNGERTPTRPAETGDYTAEFRVYNVGAATGEFELTCAGETNITCTGVGTDGRLLDDVVLEPGESVPVTVFYDVGDVGVGRLILHASVIGSSEDNGYYEVPVDRPSLEVTPDGGTARFLSGRTSIQTFTVRNTAGITVGANLAVRCEFPVVGCALEDTRVVVPRDGTESVDVQFYLVTGSMTGKITLSASTDYNPLTEEGWVRVTGGSADAPTVTVADVNPGETVERSNCLTISAGAAAAYECGDLRVVHPLPTTTTLGTARTPTLLYNSQHAHPRPVVAARVALDDGVARPDSIVATLKMEGVERAHGKWAGSEWGSGEARRIALSFDALNDPTGAYEYVLEVSNWYGSRAESEIAQGTLVVVNRSDSPFGAGWWLAGLDQLYPGPGSGTLLWVGGDGSARVFRPTGISGRWAAPSVDYPDTLKSEGGKLVRYLPNGLRVKFGAGGRHASTVNRLGHETHFRYDANGRLTSIELTPAGSGLSYRFQYDSQGKLRGVVAPPVGSQSREVIPAVVDGKLISLRNPDGTVVGFGYQGAGPYRMRVRTDRRGHTTEYTYDAVGKLASTTRDMGTYAEGKARPPIETRFEAPDARALPGSGGSNGFSSIDPQDFYATLDGPRTDVRDVTLFWVDRLGQPTKTRDPLGNETVIAREDPRWPGLVTRLEHPNGRVLTAEYDDRGNVSRTTDWSRFRDTGATRAESRAGEKDAMYELFADGWSGATNPKEVERANGTRQYATTRYEWDRKWDFVTKIVPPERDSTVIAYDPTNGNRLWQQDARGPESRVEYDYNALGRLESVDAPLTPPRRLRYDALGNLREIQSPRGFVTTHYKDAIGRDTLIVSPIDTLGAFTKRERFVYDLMDRVVRREVTAPQKPFNAAPETEPESLIVVKSYDVAGNVLSVSRRASPDINNIGAITTEWRYDAANRQVVELTPTYPPEAAPARDSTFYDAAGNPIVRYTRRGHVIRMRYDALNRLVERIVPPASYEEWDPKQGYNEPMDDWTLPKYTEGYTAPTDVATFTYDVVGNMLTANNRDARISRTYNPDGTLATDTLRIRTFNGNDYSRHVYGLEYGYDLNGRRIWMKHPSNIAPRVDGSVKDRVTYTYGAAGRPETVTDVLGNRFEYGYDVQGRLARIDYPGRIWEEYHYETQDGRFCDGLPCRRVLETRRYGGNEERFDGPVIHDDTLFYDARGKIIEARTVRGRFHNIYGGLGAIRSWSSSQPVNVSQESFVPDAMGNQRETLSNPVNGEMLSTHRISIYEPGTGRLWAIRYPGHVAAGTRDYYDYFYDEAGNQDRVFHMRWTRSGGFYKGPNYHVTGSYYDAAGQLRATDTRTCTWEPYECWYPTDIPFNIQNVFEEYRYDALGRRVLVRARYDDDHCLLLDEREIFRRCPSYIQRTVWDGDQILYEIRYPGADDVSDSDLERDQGPVYEWRKPYGRVAYTHGVGIDRPLDMIRMEYSAQWPEPQVVVPYVNWRGSYDIGSFADGTERRCVNYFEEETCVALDWPAEHEQLFFEDVTKTFTPPKSWFGSLITRQRDASGQLYKRNRYYDPATGRFTQEDPIGLAGGLNLYGFAEGDPVNFSDPFGLFPGTFPNLPLLFGLLASEEGAETEVTINLTTPLGSVDLLSGEESMGITSTLIDVGAQFSTGTPIEGDAVTVGGLSAKLGWFSLSTSYTFGTDGGCKMNVCFGAGVGIPNFSFSYTSDDMFSGGKGKSAPKRDPTIAPADATSTAIYLNRGGPHNLPLVQPIQIGRTR